MEDRCDCYIHTLPIANMVLVIVASIPHSNKTKSTTRSPCRLGRDPVCKVDKRRCKRGGPQNPSRPTHAHPTKAKAWTKLGTKMATPMAEKTIPHRIASRASGDDALLLPSNNSLQGTISNGAVIRTTQAIASRIRIDTIPLRARVILDLGLPETGYKCRYR